MTRSVQAFAYVRPSVLETSAAGRLLGPKTSGGLTPAGAGARPRFFSGFPASPRAAACGLLAVADVAVADYRRRPRSAPPGPVVTGNGDRPRCGSLSGGGVYARLVVLRDGPGGADTGHGTADVSVSGPPREALSRLPGDGPPHPRVGPGGSALTTAGGAVVEKKVPERGVRVAGGAR